MSHDRKAHEMSQPGLCTDELGQRCGWWLRMAWSGSRAKNVANLLGISEQQAKRLLGGARPTSEQLTRLAKHFGWRFVEFVFEPAVGTPAMFAEMQAMDQRLAKLEAEREAEDARGALATTWKVARNAGADARGDRTVAKAPAETAETIAGSPAGMPRR